VTAIETRGLHKDYGLNHVVVHALQGVDVGFEPGEFTAIAGPSGSGKSTLLHLIGCLDRPTRGEILIDGVDVSGLSRADQSRLRRTGIGFVFQAYNLIPVLTALENVTFPLTLLGESARDARRTGLEILAAVGLESMESRRPKELSGGQQQRVAIARALIKKPRIVLADEPTANLDSKTGSEILGLMLELNRTSGTTFLFSTHDTMVMDFARRLVLLRDGKVVEDRHK
jgi:putative ABC transport system ATP-binding protein